MSEDLKNKFIELKKAEYNGDEKMAKYFKNDTFDVIEAQGFLIPIEKPTIKTRFCFGYGLNGVAVDGDYERARDEERHAQESIKNFMDENLRKLNEEIIYLKYFLIDANDWQAREDFYNNNRDSIPYKIHFQKMYLYENCYSNNWQGVFIGYSEEDFNYNRVRDSRTVEATKADILKYIDALENCKQAFIKRLNTYLKRFGLTKLKTWTYLVD